MNLMNFHIGVIYSLYMLYNHYKCYITVICPSLWTMHTFNERYVDLNVDWSSSFNYFNQDEPSYVTSMKASYTKSCKIKNLLESLPVMAKLQALRLHVYDNSWSRCIKCKQQTESFQHIWICPVTLDILYQIIQSAKQQLLDWILQLTRP